MKINYLIAFLFASIISLNSFGQAEKFDIGNGKIEPLVQSVSGMKSDSIYAKSNEWINYNFKKADAVTGSSIDNKMIRFTGINPSFSKVSDILMTSNFKSELNLKKIAIE